MRFGRPINFFSRSMASHPAKTSRRSPTLWKRSAKSLNFLSVDTKTESPVEARRLNPHFDSPARFDPEAIRAEAFQPAFARIHRLLSGKESK